MAFNIDDFNHGVHAIELTLFFSCSPLPRHKTTIPTLREMVPDDLVNYCQEHGLLDSVLGESDTAASRLSQSSSATGGHRVQTQYFKSLE